jgi:hypothetical protein
VNASSTLVEPAYCHIPPYEKTLGPEVSDLARLASFGPDPEQELALDAIFARAAGRSAAFEVAVIACRQNIKTGIFKQAALGWLFITGERLVVWSAHEFPTAQEAFRDLEVLITGSDYLRREVKNIYRGNGDESIELLSGARLIFKTRTKGGGRGLSGNKVILDEGMFLRPMHMGALLPTLSAQPDPQVLYGASAGMPESEVLRGVRDRGRAGGDPRLAYIEYCAPTPAQACERGSKCDHGLSTPGCGCDNPANWARGNPSLGRRRANGTGLTAEYIAAERRALPPAEFGRERMGWWDDPGDGMRPLDLAAWAARADPSSAAAGRVAFGFEIRPDQSSAAIAVAGRRADGLGHGEITGRDGLLDCRPGTGWLVDRIMELAGQWDPYAVALNASGQSGTVIRELTERGFEAVRPGKEPPPGKRALLVLGSREWAQACGALVRDVSEGGWRHLGQEPLDAAAEGAGTRPLEDAYAWSYKNSTSDIAPLNALTAARYAFTAWCGAAQPFFASWR